MSLQQVKNYLSEQLFLFADRKSVRMRHFIYMGCIFIFFVSAALVGYHASEHTKEKFFSGYSFTAIAIAAFAFALIYLDRQAVNWVIEGDRSFLTLAKGKFFNLFGPVIGVILAYFLSEKFQKPISSYLLLGMCFFTMGIFTIQMLLIPIKTDFGLLDSSIALIIGLSYRDFPVDWKVVGMFIVFGLILFLKASYEALLVQRDERQRVLLEVELLAARETISNNQGRNTGESSGSRGGKGRRGGGSR